MSLSRPDMRAYGGRGRSFVGLGRGDFRLSFLLYYRVYLLLHNDGFDAAAKADGRVGLMGETIGSNTYIIAFPRHSSYVQL